MIDALISTQNLSMGWWETGAGQVGDGPKDAVWDVLNNKWLAEHGKPTWKELVDLLTTALHAEQVFGAKQGQQHAVVVTIESGETLRGEVLATPPSAVEVAKLLVGSIAY